jgi:hypothetical protein
MPSAVRLQQHLSRWLLLYAMSAIAAGYPMRAWAASRTGGIGNLTTVAVFLVIYPMTVNPRQGPGPGRPQRARRVAGPGLQLLPARPANGIGVPAGHGPVLEHEHRPTPGLPRATWSCPRSSSGLASWSASSRYRRCKTSTILTSNHEPVQWLTMSDAPLAQSAVDRITAGAAHPHHRRPLLPSNEPAPTSTAVLTPKAAPTMLDNTSKWSHARGNTVVPSRWEPTNPQQGCLT